jgi:predicted outer membrane protein
MRIHFLRTAVASCTLAIAPVTAFAQVGSPVVQPRQAVGQPNQQVVPGGVITPGQAVRTANQTTANPTTDVRQTHTANASTQGSGSVQDFFVTKLMLANKAEVELGQMAEDRAESDEVKKFAQMLVQEHQQMNQQLAQIQAGAQSTSGQSNSLQGTKSQIKTVTDQPATTQGDISQPIRSTQAVTSNAAGQSRTGGSHDQVPQQLTMICQQAAAKHLEMSREMLDSAESHDFDMSFLGLQIAKHAYVVAELQSLQNVGSPEFQQLVRTAEQKTSQHLVTAKELANQLKNDKSKG